MPSSRLDSSFVSAPKASIIPTIGGPYFALAVLFGMNLLNYIDRYSFFAVGTSIKRDLTIDDKWYGVLGGSFMIVYTIISPLMGWLGDRYNRRMILAGGVGLWSVATVGTAFSHNFYEMFFWRACWVWVRRVTGSLLRLCSRIFSSSRSAGGRWEFTTWPCPSARRWGSSSRVGLSLALGLESRFPRGWHPRAAGGPGRADHPGPRPGRVGRQEILRQGRPAKTPGLRGTVQDADIRLQHGGNGRGHVRDGAYAAWGSIFYQRVRGMPLKEANYSIGILLAGAGLVGIALSTFIADLLRKVTRRAYLLLASIVVLLSVPLGIIGILDPARRSHHSGCFSASVLMAMVLGPSNTVTANVVPANRRAAGYALFIFLIHLFGDISSPILLGWISGVFGSQAVTSSALGHLLNSIGAGPTADESGVMTNLTVAMLSVGPVLLLGGILFLIGSKHLPEDMDRVAASKDPHAG